MHIYDTFLHFYSPSLLSEYLVVLAKRRDYILFWTAYPVLRDHRKKKLNKEYKEYLEAGDAQKDGTVTPSTHGRWAVLNITQM